MTEKEAEHPAQSQVVQPSPTSQYGKLHDVLYTCNVPYLTTLKLLYFLLNLLGERKKALFVEKK